MNSITLKNPFDMHLHLRQGDILKAVLPFSAQSFSGGVVMPNLKTPVTTLELANSYKEQIKALAPDFLALMTIYITDSLNKESLGDLSEAGIKILKLYPKGATTNSDSGVSSILNPNLLEILKVAEDLGMILSIHGESDGFSMDREYEFLKVFESLAMRFPRLHIILEHMSDHRSIQVLENFENITATLTYHHITMDLDSLLGKNLNPHHFCKPILKTPKDREALLDLALNAHKKVSFGSDSAPHLTSNKYSLNAFGGIFSAPNLLPRLAELFEKHNKLENLQAFVSDNAIRNYKLSPKKDKVVTLKKSPCKIPETIPVLDSQIIPLFGGEDVSWQQLD